MSLCESTPFLTDVHRFLDKAQAFPIVGPVLASPVKAIVSIAQTIVAIAAFVFFRALLSFTQNITIIRLSLEQSVQVILGIDGLTSSLANMITLGYAAYKNEQQISTLAPFSIMSLNIL
jgi:hypothetical protein